MFEKSSTSQIWRGAVTDLQPLVDKIERLVVLSDERHRTIHCMVQQMDDHKATVRNIQNQVINFQQSHKQPTEVNMKELQESVQQIDMRLSKCDAKLKKSQELLHDCQKRISSNSIYSVSSPPSQHTLAVTALKELCWQVTTQMYRTVFPDCYAARRKYSCADIRNKINRLTDDLKRQEKTDVLDRLVEQISWNGHIENTIQQLLDDYESEQVLQQFKLTRSSVELIFNSNILDNDDKSTIRQLVQIWELLKSKLRTSG